MVAFSPPDPIATRIRPVARPATAGITARAMCPSMIRTAETNIVRSEPSSRSATQPPTIENRYTDPP